MRIYCIKLLVFPAAILAASACTFDRSGVAPSDPSIDAGVIDATAIDARPIDAAIDAALPDAMLPDAMLPDAMLPPVLSVGYWRMESDDDADPMALSVVNEIAGGPPLTASDCAVEGTVPVTPIPATGDDNVGALVAPNDINGTIAYDPALDATSMSIEYWARTNEGAAVMFDRSVDINTDGLRIDSPNNVRVRYHVSDGGGGATQVTLLSNHDMDGNWRHYAFIYDEQDGMGCLYVDGAQQACDDGVDGRPLVWAADTDIRVGVGFDGVDAAQAIFDELRITDQALATDELLNAP